MTQRFILDENVVILAQKVEDDSGRHDITCLRLLTQIIQICHTLVVDPILWKKYQSQLSGLTSSGSPVGVGVLRLLANASRTDGKIVVEPDADSFPDEARIPPDSLDDLPIVRLTIATGASLVTTDQALIDDLRGCGLTTTYGLDLWSPDEAIDTL